MATDIALHNPRVYPVYAAILSTLLDHMPPTERLEAVNAILRKFEKVPNSGHLHVWMQRFAVPMEIPLLVSEPICKAIDDPEFQLWASDWLPAAYGSLLRAENYVDQGILGGLTPVIEAEEVQLFGYDY